MLKTSTDRATGWHKITFSLPAGPEAVSVVGNFNDWTPGAHVLRKRGASRSVSVVVPENYITVFRYLGEGGHWFDEPEASYVDAGASVVLPPAPAAARRGRVAQVAKTTAKAATRVVAKVPAQASAAKDASASVATSQKATPTAKRTAKQAVSDQPAPKKPVAKKAAAATKGAAAPATKPVDAAAKAAPKPRTAKRG